MATEVLISIDVTSELQSYFDKGGLSVPNLNAKLVVDEVNGTDTITITADSASFGTNHLTDNLNIIIVFDNVSKSLISSSGIDAIAVGSSVSDIESDFVDWYSSNDTDNGTIQDWVEGLLSGADITEWVNLDVSEDTTNGRVVNISMDSYTYNGVTSSASTNIVFNNPTKYARP